MARRRVLTFFATAIVFVLLGATGTYLAFSIPNDVRAEALLKEARSDLQTGDRDAARQKFENVVRNYPRTDAAAAATIALFRMLDQDRKDLTDQMAKVEEERTNLRKQMGELDKRVSEASQKAEQAALRPAHSPPKPAVKKPTPRKTTTRRRRS